MSRRTAVAAALLILITGCAGPDNDLEVGFKEVPTDVILGGGPTPSATAGPAGPTLVIPPPPPPPPPSVVTLPPPPFEPVVRPEPPPPAPVPTQVCPPVDPLAAPKLEAPTTVTAPPVAAAYLFRNRGSYEVTGADARKGAFPATTMRTVGNIAEASAGDFSYEVAELVGDTTTTTTYRVLTDTAVPGQAGIYVTRMDYRRTDGEAAAFTPTPPIRLAALPLVRGAVEQVRAVDPTTQTTMTFTSTVTGKKRVYACGEPLDTWTLDLSEGRLVTATSDLDFASTYQLGTQFGGLIVADSVAFQGTDGGVAVRRVNAATIDQIPKVPPRRAEQP